MGLDTRVIPLHRHPLGFIEAFTQMGVDLDDLLCGTGISPRMFEMQGTRISYRQQQKLIRNGIALSPEPGAGLRVGLSFDWSFWGPVGFVVHCSPSLKAAGEALKRYIVSSQPYYALLIARPNTYLDVDLRVVEPLDYPTVVDGDPDLQIFLHEFRLAITVRMWDLCGNKQVADPHIHVELDYPPPAYADCFEQLPCTSLRFDAGGSRVSGSAELVFEPFRPYRKRTYERLIQQCEQELEDVPVCITWCDRVRWHIRAHFNRGISLEQVAEGMQMSSRALARRLAAEDATFRQLLHAVRMEMASHQLRSSDLSVDAVSEMLGFSCASSLRRALKNWSGNTISHIKAAGDRKGEMRSAS